MTIGGTAPASNAARRHALARFLPALAPVFFVTAATFALAATASPGLAVTASCERKPSKGRVTCEVEIEADAGRIVWADVVVTRAPPFAPPLRARVSMTEARSRTGRRIRIPVSLVATTTGRGTVNLRARATLCEGTEAGDGPCRPATRDVAAELVVGTDVERQILPISPPEVDAQAR